MDPTDFDLLTRTVAGEAGNDPSAPAVAHVILNRLNSGQYGSTVPSVLFAPGQFEAWGDPQAAQRIASLDPQSPTYQRAAAVVAQAVSGGKDPTNGATHYYAPQAQAALGRRPPAWDDGTGVMIGSQKFFGGEPQAMTDDDIAKLWIGPGAPQQNGAPTTSNMSDADIAKLWIGPGAPQQNGAPIPGSAQAQIQSLIGAKESPASQYADTAAFDRTAPLSQQLSNAAGRTAQYALGQIAGYPTAVGNEVNAARGLMEQGINEIGQGQGLPSFPSANPRTWGAGGYLKTATGALGIPYSPLSAAVDQGITGPVTQATGNPEIGLRAGIVANALAPNAVANYFRGVPTDPETLRLANVAATNNIPIRAPQISNNALVRKMDQAISWIPGSGAAAQTTAQQNAFTRAVSRTFGEDTPQITRQTVADAQQRIGGEMNRVEQNATVPIDDTLLTGLGNVEQNARQTFGPDSDQYRRVDNQITRILGVAQQNKGTIPGDAFGTLIHKGSPLDNLISGQDTDVARQASGIKETLMDALQRNISPEDAEAYSNARFQYKNLKTVENLVTKGTPGEISPLGLNQRVNAQFGTTNAGPLGELADTAQKFMRKPPESGTPLGQLTLRSLEFPGAVAGAAMSGGHALGASIPETLGYGVMAPLATAMTARGINALLNNPIYRNALLRGGTVPTASNALALGALGQFGAGPGYQKQINALQQPSYAP